MKSTGNDSRELITARENVLPIVRRSQHAIGAVAVLLHDQLQEAEMFSDNSTWGYPMRQIPGLRKTTRREVPRISVLGSISLDSWGLAVAGFEAVTARLGFFKGKVPVPGQKKGVNINFSHPTNYPGLTPNNPTHNTSISLSQRGLAVVHDSLYGGPRTYPNRIHGELGEVQSSNQSLEHMKIAQPNNFPYWLSGFRPNHGYQTGGELTHDYLASSRAGLRAAQAASNVARLVLAHTEESELSWVKVYQSLFAAEMEIKDFGEPWDADDVERNRLKDTRIEVAATTDVVDGSKFLPYGSQSLVVIGQQVAAYATLSAQHME